MIKTRAQAILRIKSLIHILLNREGIGSLRDHLIQGASWSLALKIVSTGLAFATSVLLARLLGAEGYGIFAYAIAIVSLLSVPASLGLPQLLVRNIAAYRARSEWGLMRGLLVKANTWVLLSSVGLGTMAALIAWLLAGRSTNPTVMAFWLALLILPINALNNLRSSTLRGLHYVVLGQLPEFLIKPLSFLLLVVAAHLLLGDVFNAPWAVGMQVTATALGLGAGVLFLLNRLPSEVTASDAMYDTTAWARSALPFLFIGGMQMIYKNTDIVMLGALSGAEAAGVYRVVTRGADLVAFVLIAVNMVLQPTVARFYAAGEIQRLQRLVTKSARMIFLGSLPIALVLILFGQWILLIFGQEFTVGASALAVLSVAQLINAGMGSVALVLSMTGHERKTAVGVAVAACINVVLNASLIPLWGIEGAATATATSITIWNILLAIWVYKELKIYPTVLGEAVLKRR